MAAPHCCAAGAVTSTVIGQAVACAQERPHESGVVVWRSASAWRADARRRTVGRACSLAATWASAGLAGFVREVPTGAVTCGADPATCHSESTRRIDAGTGGVVVLVMGSVPCEVLAHLPLPHHQKHQGCPSPCPEGCPARRWLHLVWLGCWGHQRTRVLFACHAAVAPRLPLPWLACVHCTVLPRHQRLQVCEVDV